MSKRKATGPRPVEVSDFESNAATALLHTRQQLQQLMDERNYIEALMNVDRTFLAALIYQQGQLIVTNETIAALHGRPFSLKRMKDEDGIHLDMDLEDIVEAEAVDA